MSLVYRYRTIDGRGSPIKRPIDVESINGSKRFTVKALLDSGADSCAISSDIATALGLDTGGERGVSLGVTGSVESVIRTLNIRLSVAHESYNLKVPVRYSSWMKGTLGHLCLFSEDRNCSTDSG